MPDRHAHEPRHTATFLQAHSSSLSASSSSPFISISTHTPPYHQIPISPPHVTHTPKKIQRGEKKKTRTTTYIVKCPLNLTLSLPSENADSAHPGGRTPSGLTFPSWTSLIEVMRWRRRISMNEISLYANYVMSGELTL